jgi:hypothetical protein
MKEFLIFTDGDVDLPAPYDAEVGMLPQYYYFDENMVYGDEQILSRDEFSDSFLTAEPIPQASTLIWSQGVLRKQFRPEKISCALRSPPV